MISRRVLVSLLLALAAGPSAQAEPPARDRIRPAGAASPTAEQRVSDFVVNFGKVFADRQALVEKAENGLETDSSEPDASIDYAALTVTELAAHLRARNSATVLGTIGELERRGDVPADVISDLVELMRRPDYQVAPAAAELVLKLVTRLKGAQAIGVASNILPRLMRSCVSSRSGIVQPTANILKHLREQGVPIEKGFAGYFLDYDRNQVPAIDVFASHRLPPPPQNEAPVKASPDAAAPEPKPAATAVTPPDPELAVLQSGGTGAVQTAALSLGTKFYGSGKLPEAAYCLRWYLASGAGSAPERAEALAKLLAAMQQLPRGASAYIARRETRFSVVDMNDFAAGEKTQDMPTAAPREEAAYFTKSEQRVAGTVNYLTLDASGSFVKSWSECLTPESWKNYKATVATNNTLASVMLYEMVGGGWDRTYTWEGPLTQHICDQLIVDPDTVDPAIFAETGGTNTTGRPEKQEVFSSTYDAFGNRTATVENEPPSPTGNHARVYNLRGSGQLASVEIEQTPGGFLARDPERAAKSCAIPLQVLRNRSDKAGYTLLVDETIMTFSQLRDILQWAYDNKKIRAEANGSSGFVSNLEGDERLLADLGYGVTFWARSFHVQRGKKNAPAVGISWYGARALCNYRSDMEGLPRCTDFADWGCDFSKKGYRLLTPEEWIIAYGAADTLEDAGKARLQVAIPPVTNGVSRWQDLHARQWCNGRGSIGYWFIGHAGREGLSTACYCVTCGDRTSAAGSLPGYMWNYCHVDTEPDVTLPESMFRMVREVPAQPAAARAGK